jgi:osmotically inducible protein OsmC
MTFAANKMPALDMAGLRGLLQHLRRSQPFARRHAILASCTAISGVRPRLAVTAACQLCASGHIAHSGACYPGCPLKEILMKKKASAVWKGGIKDGKGSISTESGILSNAQYGFNSRFEDGPGTNPEELLGAAHAGCFSMALSKELGSAGMTATSIETNSTITLEKVGDGFSITAAHLDVVATIPGADQTAFDIAAQSAKTGCPVSKLFNAKITMTATLKA